MQPMGMLKWSATALVALSMSAVRDGAQTPNSQSGTMLRARLVEQPCTDSFGTFDGVQRDLARCGSVTLPQDRNSPNDQRLTPVVLPVVIYASPSARGTPLVFLAGGPGESSIDAVQQVLLRTPTGQMLLRERPIIAFDRRGISTATGRTSPDLGAIPFTPRYPRTSTLGALRDSAGAAAKALRSHGIDLRNFTTLAALDDIADVIHALGYQRVILFGVSYGTRDALQFMHKYPGMVESVVLDGVAPPSAANILDSATVSEAGIEIVARIIADCRRDPTCSAEYSDLPEAVKQLASGNLEIVRRTANFPVAGGWKTLAAHNMSVLSVLGLASSSEAVRAEVPLVIVDFANGDTLRTDLSAQVLAAAASDPALAPWHSERVPLVRFIAFCGDRPQGEPYIGNRTICDQLHVPFSGSQAIATISSDIPALLISSGDDAQTPPGLAIDAARTLSHGQRVFFPSVGHVAFPRPIAMACAAIVIESFLSAPDRPAATGCVGSVAPAFQPRGLTVRARARR